ncbi:MAG: Asp-tRNA(Asn)/Glu-tRNA(Gln) amidotransferase subunit GatC [Pseudomonadota bacterium]|nr:Asp-tRNA(Asn)/Glu-tRNA(Gln) amidotransferase subunit GatC [Pseudomonadota bacterium]
MSIDNKIVEKIAKLSRISLEGNEVNDLSLELSQILDWVEQLSEINTDDISPIFSSFDDADNINLREDRVSDGGYRDKVISNAPMSEDGFFLVPKVVD